jgi:phage terminase large subunit-like protein
LQLPANPFACPDWADRIAEGRSLVPALPLDEGEARRAVDIFDQLRLPDVPGTPTLADAAGDWFRDIVRAVLGSLDPVTGLRGVADVFLLVPKKNSKTTGGGGLMLTALAVNERPEAPFGLFGPTQEIADIAYATVEGMIELHPVLKKLLKVQSHLKRVEHRRTGAVLKVTTFDPKVATGGKYAGWLLDEAHLLGRVAYAARVVAQLRGARVAVPESFGVIITTQSDEPPAGLFREELAFARGVRDGRIASSSYMPVLYEFPEELQTDKFKAWRNPARWPMVLPNLGRSVRMEILTREYADARARGDAAERLWASQHLNIEIGLALQSDRWSGADHWEEAAEPGLDLPALLARCEVAAIGIDGGGLDDLLAVTVIGRQVDGTWLLWGKAWVDEKVLRSRPDLAPRLSDIAASGDLDLVSIDTGRQGAAHAGRAEGAAQREARAAQSPDVLGVAAVVRQVFEAGLLPEKNGVGVDPVGVSAIVDALGFLPEGCLTGVAQGFRLTGAIQGMARKLADGGLVHGGQPLMAFAVENARQETRGNAVLITKQVAGRAKIDPLLAALNAFSLMSLNPEAVAGSYLDSDDLMVA